MSGSAVLKAICRLVAACLSIGVLDRTPVQAAEAASGFYLLGSKTAMAGFVPPAGTYGQSLTYFYSGDANATLPFAGRAVAGVNADVLYELGIATWVAPRKVFGGSFAAGVMVPIGYKDVSASVELDILDNPVALGVEQDGSAFGDPVALAMIGWQSGNWYWNIQGLLNVPVGYWQRRNLTNIGFNRWAFDLSAAATWLNPKTGIELSGTAGVTFNAENPTTDYQTGIEGHLEFALMQHVGKTFSFGLAGYHYQQLTGDSGSGARLGPFKGRVTALGPMVTATIMAGTTPISTSLSWLHEFDAKNRLEGDAALLNVVVPLGK